MPDEIPHEVPTKVKQIVIPRIRRDSSSDCEEDLDPLPAETTYASTRATEQKMPLQSKYYHSSSNNVIPGFLPFSYSTDPSHVNRHLTEERLQRQDLVKLDEGKWKMSKEVQGMLAQEVLKIPSLAALSEEERAQLIAQVVAEGCYDSDSEDEEAHNYYRWAGEYSDGESESRSESESEGDF